ncbi:hypothetical protein BD410DRAFT_791234 [Rickenella mellea]|uniref:Uncharacterized protein n=1 Tax=Rickenella mellea TaxID=50990 RepID=A0A4Y7PYI2_9AGAM|nr:hypothetical protein BD410DRAFT_791234 [Rickenella mellea]
MALTLVASTFRSLLTPIAPFTWYDIPISTLDVLAALRLCVVLRQLREVAQAEHRASRSSPTDGSIEKRRSIEEEEKSFVKDATTALVVVYGGEAVVLPWLGTSPSFLFSPVVPGLYTFLTYVVESLPSIPPMSLKTELPLSILDGFSRSYLLCDLIPPVVTTLKTRDLADSPWTMLISALFIPNTGFLLVSVFSMLHPAGYALATPPELSARGWTTMDIWVAPLVTGLYALTTHTQPAWGAVHEGVYTLVRWTAMGGDGEGEKGVHAVDRETARAACAILLMGLFITRTMKNFGGDYVREMFAGGFSKKVIIRSKVDGKPYRGKVKTQ